MTDCIFCEIVAGRRQSYRVLEDAHTVAFLDIRPATRGHTLVVPRVHARDVWEISATSHGQLADMVHRVAALVKRALEPDGVSIRHATGEAAGQEVFHFHTHVIPRWRGDDWNSGPASPAELERVLERITAEHVQKRAGRSSDDKSWPEG